MYSKGAGPAGPFFNESIYKPMFLTAYNLPHYLMSRGLVTTESVVAGDFILAETGRRNRNFKIMRRTQPGLFVKQIKTAEPQAMGTLQREAAFYRTVHTDPRYTRIRSVIPKFVDSDPSRHALTLSLTENAMSMAEHHTRMGAYPESTAHMLGWTLGLVHAHGPDMLADPAMRAVFPCQTPWPLLFDQTGYSFLDAFGPIGAQLTSAIQQLPALQPKLSALRPYWQFDSVIHGDMKWDNCLVTHRADGQAEVTIVDWELADLGDGAWDVASIFKEYLFVTLFHASASQYAGTPAQPFTPQTIETLRPSIRAFWQAYATVRGFAPEQARAYLDRAVRYTAGRMIVGVLEYLAASPQYAVLIPTILQTSLSLLDAPHIAAAQMTGVQLN